MVGIRGQTGVMLRSDGEVGRVLSGDWPAPGWEGRQVKEVWERRGWGACWQEGVSCTVPGAPQGLGPAGPCTSAG